MKDVLSVSKKPAPQSHRSPKRPEKGAPKNARPSLPASAFLPTTRAEADARGWGQLDFVYVSGDAYVDHPSFGSAIITRVLESHGYKVGFIAQPDWNDPESVAVFGEPRLGFLVSAGNMDSMVNHYTVNKKRRRDDAYTPGGKGGARPNHAAVVYSNLIRRTFKETPIILGGIEASLPGSPITTTGLIPSSAPSCSIPGPISSPTAWGSALSSRLPMPSLRAFP